MKKSFVAEFDTEINSWQVRDIKGFKQVIIGWVHPDNKNDFKLLVI